MFNDTLSSSIVPPLGAKYVKYEILVIPNPAKSSSYLLDNLFFEEIIPQKSLLDSNFSRFRNVTNNSASLPLEQYAGNEYVFTPGMVHDKSIDRNDNDFLGVELGRDKKGEVIDYGNTSYDHSFSRINNGSTSFPIVPAPYNNLLQTKPIPVKEDTVYNYTIGVEGNNLDYFASLASFRNDSDIVENRTKYGVNASDGNILSLSPGSEIYTNLDVLKPSNYTIALRTSACIDRCDHHPLTLTIVGLDPNNTTNDFIKTTNLTLKGHDSTSTPDNQVNEQYHQK